MIPAKNFGSRPAEAKKKKSLLGTTSLTLHALEQRYLLDAAGVATGTEVLTEQMAHLQTDAAIEALNARSTVPVGGAEKADSRTQNERPNDRFVTTQPVSAPPASFSASFDTPSFDDTLVSFLNGDVPSVVITDDALAPRDQTGLGDSVVQASNSVVQGPAEPVETNETPAPIFATRAASGSGPSTLDTDGDTVADVDDVDDDNDGILDTEEGFQEVEINFLQNESFEVNNGITGGIGSGVFNGNVAFWDLVWGTADFLDGDTNIREIIGGAAETFDASDGEYYAGFHSGDGSTGSISNPETSLTNSAGNREVIIHSLATPLEAGVTYTLTFDVANYDWRIGPGQDLSTGIEFYTIEQGSDDNNGTLSSVDIDNDGINNYNDRDFVDANSLYADGTVVGGLASPDGINFIENITGIGDADDGFSTVSVTFTPTANVDRILLTPESGRLQYLLVDNLRLTNGQVNIVTVDFDGDGIANHLDIDSDNDGIPDNIEAQTTDGFIAPSGVGGTSGFTDVNRDGLDDNFDNRNADNGNTLDMNSAAATGAEALIKPVDTDNDGDDDFLETDSDNEGGNDAQEAGFGRDPVPANTLSDNTNDADGDGLFDVFDTQNMTTADDGFNVNESLDQGAIAFPDSDRDAVMGVPLTADVDFRDAQADPFTNEAPTIDLDVLDNPNIEPDPSNGVIPLVITAPINIQTDMDGNTIQATYRGVATVNGVTVDLIATLNSIEIIEPSTGNMAGNTVDEFEFNTSPFTRDPNDPNFGLFNANNTVPGDFGRANVTYSLVDQATGNPVPLTFTVLFGDFDGNASNGNAERIIVNAGDIDAFILEDGTGGANNDDTPGTDIIISEEVINGETFLTFAGGDNDPTPVIADTGNAVQLVFSNTSAFSVTLERDNAGRNIGFNAEVANIFGTPVIEDTNTSFENIFTEGQDPVNVASQTADVDDVLEADITRLSITPGNIADGTAEVITFNGDSGASVSLALDGTDTSQQSLTVGGTDIFIQFDMGSLVITAQDGGVIPQDDLDTLLRAITYENTSDTPTTGPNSDRTLTFSVTDSGGLTSNDAVSTITVLPVNDDPDAVDDGPITVTGGMATSIDVVGGTGDASADSDPENDPLTITEIIDPNGGMPTTITIGDGMGETPVGDTITLASGTQVVVNGNGTVTVTTLLTASGTETFDYTISDGNGGMDTATVTLDRSSGQMPPIAQDDAFTIDENPEGLEIGVITNGSVLADNGSGLDSDPDSDPLSVTQINGDDVTNGNQITLDSGASLTIRTDGTFDYDPNGAFDFLDDGETGTDSFTYTISDGQGGTDTATVTITIRGDTALLALDTDGDTVADVDDVDDDNDGILDTE
ncbi:MAG: Ig-like domain-containing protein, partial [Pseudomonadota bacterium]